MALDLNSYEFGNKKVLVRTDFNIPLDASLNPADLFRIEQSLPTINKICESQGTAIILSHIGRPSAGYSSKYSLKNLLPALQLLTQRKVIFVPSCVGAAVQKSVREAKNGEIVLLENIRFHEEEMAGDLQFSREVAKLGEIFINDGFSVSHRAHSSIAILPTLFSEENKGLGYSATLELNALEKIMQHPSSTFTGVIGGSKVSTKLAALRHLATKVDNLVVGGAMAFAFLKAMNVNIGASFYEDSSKEMCLAIIQACKKNNVTLHLPIDVVAARSLEDSDNKTTYALENLPQDFKAFDIGPKTIKLFSQIISNSKTILWNGPMGVFEEEPFSTGTGEIAKAISEQTSKQAYSLCGGGDTVAAINHLSISKNFSHISSAGGAMLDYLAGMQLPGIYQIINS